MNTIKRSIPLLSTVFIYISTLQLLFLIIIVYEIFHINFTIDFSIELRFATTLVAFSVLFMFARKPAKFAHERYMLLKYGRISKATPISIKCSSYTSTRGKAENINRLYTHYCNIIYKYTDLSNTNHKLKSTIKTTNSVPNVSFKATKDRIMNDDSVCLFYLPEKPHISILLSDIVIETLYDIHDNKVNQINIKLFIQFTILPLVLIVSNMLFFT